MFTKVIFPVTASYFLENNPVSVLGNIRYSGVARFNDRPWVALTLVLCAHLGVFAALRPQPQSLSVEPIPAPIMISLLSTPQTTPQKPMSKEQKPVKTPGSKPLAPVIKQANRSTAPLVEQTSMPTAATNTPAAEPETKTADTQTYQSPSFNAAYLNNPAPNYPSVSRRLGEQGLVLLHVQVTEDGTAGSVTLQTSSSSTRLDQAALEAVKKWRFIPAKRGEQPVSASVVVPVRFSIEG